MGMAPDPDPCHGGERCIRTAYGWRATWWWNLFARCAIRHEEKNGAVVYDLDTSRCAFYFEVEDIEQTDQSEAMHWLSLLCDAMNRDEASEFEPEPPDFYDEPEWVELVGQLEPDLVGLWDEAGSGEGPEGG